MSGDAQTQSTNDEAELHEQPRADDIDEEARDDAPDWEKSFIEMLLVSCPLQNIHIESKMLNLIGCCGNWKDNL